MRVTQTPQYTIQLRHIHIGATLPDAGKMALDEADPVQKMSIALRNYSNLFVFTTHGNMAKI